MGTVDRLLAEQADAADWPRTAGDVLMTFARRLQGGRLSRAQEARVVARLESIGASRPDATTAVAGPLQIVRQFTVGKTAPDIVGTDLDGQPLRLSAYRNKVVLVAFSAEWCAICRSQIPYERFLADRYQRWPFALLGVQTGTSRDAAKRAQDETGISSRAWWDPPAGADAPHGAIAATWQVSGWPITYVIDGNGVIRFVDVRDEDLLRAVRQLVEAQADRDAKASHQNSR
jgi:peroxiredoxin